MSVIGAAYVASIQAFGCSFAAELCARPARGLRSECTRLPLARTENRIKTKP